MVWNGIETSIESEPEVVKARNRLRLTILRENQRCFRELAESTDDEDVSKNLTDCKCDDCMSGQFRGKRKRINHGGEADGASRKQNIQFKLFDRLIDLAPYSELAPLYPICREWVKNNPKPNHVSQEEKGRGTECAFGKPFLEMRQETDVHVLPSPKPMAPRYDKYGNRIWTNANGHSVPPYCMDVNSRATLSYVGSPLYSNDANSWPSPTVLFQEHMQRWVQIRKFWKQDSTRRDKRYEASHNILQGLYQDLDSDAPKPTKQQ